MSLHGVITNQPLMYNGLTSRGTHRSICQRESLGSLRQSQKCVRGCDGCQALSISRGRDFLKQNVIRVAKPGSIITEDALCASVCTSNLRSPAMPDHHHHSSRRRSRSPERSRRDRDHRQKRRSQSPPSVQLPLNARALVKHDLKEFKRLFTLYLDIQKQIDIDDLDETEVKGRWKSFLGKW